MSSTCDYKHVAIVDDVITTGQTVVELAKLLRKNGVEKIQVWSVARALK
ncbi:MAG: phosphoribosyltransferase family protein [Gammaproteobacteria bacterium]|nr:phosphoribosyltransferase family protein [Gammaproteobacteria bacterium]